MRQTLYCRTSHGALGESGGSGPADIEVWCENCELPREKPFYISLRTIPLSSTNNTCVHTLRFQETASILHQNSCLYFYRPARSRQDSHRQRQQRLHRDWLEKLARVPGDSKVARTADVQLACLHSRTPLGLHMI